MNVGDKALLDNKVVEIVEIKWNMARIKYMHAWSWIPLSELRPLVNK